LDGKDSGCQLFIKRIFIHIFIPKKNIHFTWLIHSGAQVKLQQLRYIWEVSRRDLNISRAADALHTSQPGVSKQIRQLENELGVEIFTRTGKNLSRVSPAGQAIIDVAGDILSKVDQIRDIGREHSAPHQGSLSLATTHTQSRYVLPPVITAFIEKYPDVALHMHQGTPMQISRMVSEGTVDFAIATEALEHYSDLVMMPCYSWNRALLVPGDHELAKCSTVSLEQISRFPIVTYTFGFTGRSKLDEAFAALNLQPRVVFTAADADVIKTYVRLGLGIGIVAKMAFDARADSDLVAIDVGHLFQPSIAKIGFRPDSFLRGYMYDFIELFAPHLTHEVVEEACRCRGEESLNSLFASLDLPII
jgi:LysR family cys regulon transcriptional activator